MCKNYHWKLNLFGVDDEEVLDVGLLALLVEEQGELVAHPDPVVVLHRRRVDGCARFARIFPIFGTQNNVG